MTQTYTKPHASPADRVAHLRARGLGVPRPSVAARKIEQIGFERLRIYFLSRRDPQTKQFYPGTSYRDILQLYDCDALLRELCFSAVGRFELAFRNIMSETLSLRHGSHPYCDGSIFKGAESHNEALAAAHRIFGSSRDERARHYRRTYGNPVLPPIWMLKEFMTFGQADRYYRCLSTPVREAVAREFNVPSLTVFLSWLACFVDLRNAAAHHDRLFNRRFQKQPSRYRAGNVPAAMNNTLKAQLECLDHVLAGVGHKADTVPKAEKILRRYPAVNPVEAGF